MRSRPAHPATRTALLFLVLFFALHAFPHFASAAKGGKGGKDRTAPSLTVANPVDGMETTDTVVAVTGIATDDRAVVSVEASVGGGAGTSLNLSADGSFSGEVHLDGGGNAIVITARDGSGNTADVTRTVTLIESPSPIAFTSPQDGDVIQGSFVDFFGTYRDPVVNMGLMTFLGMAEGGAFEYSAYPLEEGENLIRVVGVDSDGNEYFRDITVTRIGSGRPVELHADAASGEVPLTVRYTITTDTPETPTLCEIDYRGDETYTPLDDCADGGQFTYDGSRTYVPAVRMHTAEGHRYSAETWVATHGPAVYVTEFPVENPVDLAVDDDGNIFVLEGASGRIVVIDSDGVVLRTFGGRGSGDGLFESPSSIAFDRDGSVYVSDTLNDRVQYFSPGGAFLGSWGKSGTKYGSLMSPRGIAIDYEGNVLVANAGNGRVESMRRANGHWDRSIGEDELTTPLDVLWLPGIDFAVIDGASGEVLVYSPYGGSPRRLKNKAGPFVSPVGLSYDRQDNFAVITDEGGNTVTLAKYSHETFDPKRVISSLAGDSRSLSGPRAAVRGAEVHEDIYYIADTGNNRIVKARLEEGPREDPLVVWGAVREALTNNDIDGALNHFSLQTKEKYRAVLANVEDNFPQVVTDMGELHPLHSSEEGAVYGVLRYDDDKPYLFEVRFVRDELGGWKILYW